MNIKDLERLVIEAGRLTQEALISVKVPDLTALIAAAKLEANAREVLDENMSLRSMLVSIKATMSDWYLASDADEAEQRRLCKEIQEVLKDATRSV